MHNIKYHILNVLSVTVFSFLLAMTINQFFKYGIAPSLAPSKPKRPAIVQRAKPRGFDEYRSIIDSGFFKIAVFSNEPLAASAPQSNPSELELLGTITGPSSIARALIKKKTEKDPQIYRLWSNVFGYKLVGINNNKVFLKINKETVVLDMYAEKTDGKTPGKTPPGAGQPGKVKLNISRSEIQQKVLNNVDNALKGIRAGPYRIDGKVQGFKIFRIRPNNVLYKFGARNGDVIRRINGHPLDSTEKLYKMWQAIQGDSRISVDLERKGQPMNFAFNITD